MVWGCGVVCGVTIGVPDGLNALCVHTITGGHFEYGCQVHNDTSDAPATALILESPGLGINNKVKFQESEIPLSDVMFTLLNISELEVVYDNYSLSVYAVNQLGSISIINDTVSFGKLCITWMSCDLLSRP